jgi:branched-chain amino acid transport system ATP-binding protein
VPEPGRPGAGGSSASPGFSGAAEPLLRVEQVSKRFGGLLALDGVSLEVVPGEIFSIIGPNGAGKTTLFSCLVGSIRPSAGSIRFRGEELSGLRNDQVVRRGLVRTHQIVRPFREMSVAENVRVGALFGRGRLYGAGATRRVEEILEVTQLAHRAAVHAGVLTIGELKRLEIARALATGPDVLCLDEVMGGLNPAEIQQAMGLVRRLRDGGLTILMIEHHVHAVAGLSDRLVVLNFGKKIAEGRPGEALRDPAVISAYLGDESEARE